jgi:hypothetical protein
MEAICAVAECERPVQTRGWCTKHYRRWLRHGHVEETRRWGHSVSAVDEVARTATCAICGPGVGVKRNRQGWRCTRGAQQYWTLQRTRLTYEQGGRCAICGEQVLDDPCLDHCHATGKVRGVLCRKCNIGLGYFEDSPKLLALATAYLQRQTAHAKAQAVDVA